jgi:hypothetical protein
MRLEFLELRSFENGSADSHHACFDFAHGHEWSGRRKGNPAHGGQQDRGGDSSSFHEVVDGSSGEDTLTAPFSYKH